MSKALARRGLTAGFRALHACGLYRPKQPPVAYVVERANWSIAWDGHYYSAAIEKRHPGTVAVAADPFRSPGRILHFGSQFVWELWAEYLGRSPTVVTFFHGKPEDGPEMARHVAFLLANHRRLAKVVTAAREVETRLLEWGVPRDKLALVPLGVDTALFQKPTPEQRAQARARLGVPADALCIGSFQKDGNGWGEGLEPKLIKGPDLFVEAVARLARDFPVFVLLTGPARGFVKQGLERHNIAYKHLWVEDYLDLPACYHALDLYLMTSREEGGPKSILESMATGVPLVSSRTGMAADVIQDGTNAALVEPGDIDGFAARAAALLADEGLRERFRQAGRETALAYDWDEMAPLLYDRVYRELLP